jgi:hypothetical protein
MSLMRFSHEKGEGWRDQHGDQAREKLANEIKVTTKTL